MCRVRPGLRQRDWLWCRNALMHSSSEPAQQSVAVRDDSLTSFRSFAADLEVVFSDQVLYAGPPSVQYIVRNIWVPVDKPAQNRRKRQWKPSKFEIGRASCRERV